MKDEDTRPRQLATGASLVNISLVPPPATAIRLQGDFNRSHISLVCNYTAASKLGARWHGGFVFQNVFVRSKNICILFKTCWSNALLLVFQKISKKVWKKTWCGEFVSRIINCIMQNPCQLYKCCSAQSISYSLHISTFHTIYLRQNISSKFNSPPPSSVAGGWR